MCVYLYPWFHIVWNIVIDTKIRAWGEHGRVIFINEYFMKRKKKISPGKIEKNLVSRTVALL